VYVHFFHFQTRKKKKRELKKQKNLDDISDKNVNVRVLYQGTQSICSKCWMGCKLSFDILLPEITLYQEEMELEIWDVPNDHITIVDRYAYLKFETTKNFTGSYNKKQPFKVQSYSRTESNYSGGRPTVVTGNPNDQYNDYYIIPFRGNQLLVITSFGLNFCLWE
jgi:hypothetical protein